MKRDSLDALFSRYIRLRDGYVCQRCFKKYPEKSQGLHCAHIFSRGKICVRYEPMNAVALCYGCHRHLDTHPELKTLFAKKRMGEEAYDLLRFKSNVARKVSPTFIKEWLKKEVLELESKN